MTSDEEGALCEAHRRLVWSRVGRMGARGKARALSATEMFAAGMEGLLHAMRRFDESTGNRFSTYAVVCIDGYICMALDDRHPLGRNASKHGSASVASRLHQAFVAPDDSRRTVARREVQELLAFLRPRERTVIRLRYLEGLDEKAVAIRMGCTRNRICQLRRSAIDRLRRRLRLTTVAAA